MTVGCSSAIRRLIQETARSNPTWGLPVLITGRRTKLSQPFDNLLNSRIGSKSCNFSKSMGIVTIFCRKS